MKSRTQEGSRQRAQQVQRPQETRSRNEMSMKGQRTQRDTLEAGLEIRWDLP